MQLGSRYKINSDTYAAQLGHLYLPITIIDNNKWKNVLFGIEIEAENVNLTRIKPELLTGSKWITHIDNSLRNNGIEFVTTVPLNLSDALIALQTFENCTKDSKFDFSNRTSVHVHMNAIGLTVKELHKFYSLFLLLENPLTLRSGGEERVGNHFCLRGTDSKAIINSFISALRTANFRSLFRNENNRYGGLNFSAFNKFGTLEFRTHRGTNSASEIGMWIETLNEILETSKEKFKSPSHIFEEFSALGLPAFMKEYLPKTRKYLLSELKEDDIYDMIYRSYHLAQSVAYCVEIDDDNKSVPSSLPSYRSMTLDQIFRNDNTTTPPIPAPNPRVRSRPVFTIRDA